MDIMQVQLDPIAGVVLLVFIGTYLAISSEKVNRTATALLGMGVVGIVLWTAGTDFQMVVEHIEWNTVLFVTSMMVIVTIASSSGMFQYMAIELTRPTQGYTKRLFVYLLAFVFVISLFFDTTSTILVMAPVTIELCKALEIDFRPFLIAEAITCNFASIPSIVGAVPNLVIADEAQISPGLLFESLMPLSIILFIISIPIFLKMFEDKLVPSEDHLISEMMLIDPQYMIRSRRDFYLSLIAMLILVLGFMVGPSAGFEASMVAITVAAGLLLLCREWVDEILKRVNWGTVFFLIGLFGLVAALRITRIVDALGFVIGGLIQDNEAIGIVFMTWVPAGLSAVIDNIPISAVLAPIATQFSSMPLLPIALLFAVNVGGFLLPIGAPANILAMAFAEKEHQPISMLDFAKIATPMAIIMLGVGTGWLLLLSLFV